MFKPISKTVDEFEQWRGTLHTQVETSLNTINEMDAAIQLVKEEAATKILSLLKILTKKTTIFGNQTHIHDWWYKVMATRHSLFAK